MRLMSYEMGCHWLGVSESDAWPEYTKQFTAMYRLPTDSGRKTFLANLLIGWFPQETATALFVMEHGIWASGENEFLFTAFRNLAAGRAVSELSSVDDAPVLVFESSESKLFESFFAIATYFYWDAVAVAQDQKLLIKTSHDEFFSIHTDDPVLFESVISCLKSTNFELF